MKWNITYKVKGLNVIVNVNVNLKRANANANAKTNAKTKTNGSVKRLKLMVKLMANVVPTHANGKSNTM
jgi:hypothetical protein